MAARFYVGTLAEDLQHFIDDRAAPQRTHRCKSAGQKWWYECYGIMSHAHVGDFAHTRDTRAMSLLKPCRGRQRRARTYLLNCSRYVLRLASGFIDLCGYDTWIRVYIRP